mgnify:CR=1 FL=1
MGTLIVASYREPIDFIGWSAIANFKFEEPLTLRIDENLETRIINSKYAVQSFEVSF